MTNTFKEAQPHQQDEVTYAVIETDDGIAKPCSMKSSTMSTVFNINDKQSTINILHLIDFEDRLKKHKSLLEFMKMSPAIPNGFDMNCAMVDENDFMTIICETLLSNDHLYGLKE